MFLGLQLSNDSSTLVSVTSFPGEESCMITVEFITALFYEVDEQLRAIPKHPEARLWPSEVVTLGLLHALKGGGNRPFYRWLTRDYRALFPLLPERTRLFRLFTTHQDWTQIFLAAPTVLGVIDTYGIELIHPMREGRSPQQIGRKGLSNHRWIVGGKLCLLLNQWGLIVGWECAAANVADNTLQWLIRQFEECLPCRGRRSDQPQTVSARRVARPPAGGNGLVDADARLPLQESHAPRVGVFSRPARVVWLTAHRAGLRAPLDC